MGTCQNWANLIIQILQIYHDFHAIDSCRSSESLFTPIAVTGLQPTYLSKRYIKIFSTWLGLSIPKINLLDKLQCLSCQNDIFLIQMQPCDRVCLIFSLASNTTTYHQTMFPPDSKNKSLCEGRWENKTFTLEGTDFPLHIQELIPRSLLYVRLYTTGQLLCGKMDYSSIFHKEFFIELITISSSIVFWTQRLDVSWVMPLCSSNGPTSHSSYYPISVSLTDCVNFLPAPISCLPTLFHPAHLVSALPLLPLYVKHSFDIISSHFLTKI